MARGKVVIVTGIPGVGKSSVCQVAKELGAKEGIKIEILNYGDVLMELMRKKGAEIHRDQLRKMDITAQKVLQAEAAHKLAKAVEKAEGHVIIDTHMMVRTSSGYLPGLPKHVLDALKPDLLVLIEADPAEIAARRAKDLAAGERLRDEERVEELRQELALSRMFATACSVLTGAPVVIIKNPSGGLEEAGRALLKLFKR